MPRINLTVTEKTASRLQELAGGQRLMGRYVDVLVADRYEAEKGDTLESRLRKEIEHLARSTDFYLGQLKDRVTHIEDHLGGVKRD